MKRFGFPSEHPWKPSCRDSQDGRHTQPGVYSGVVWCTVLRVAAGFVHARSEDALSGDGHTDDAWTDSCFPGVAPPLLSRRASRARVWPLDSHTSSASHPSPPPPLLSPRVRAFIMHERTHARRRCCLVFFRRPSLCCSCPGFARGSSIPDSGIMCCMLGAPFSSRRRNGGSERDRFQGDVPSSSDGAGSTNNPGLM